MKVYLNRITGIDDAFVTMYISNGNWTREREADIRVLCDRILDKNGRLMPEMYFGDRERFDNYMSKLLRWGPEHITLLKFIDFSFTVDGLHRGGQDDWDSHAVRFNNRIIRLSTRGQAHHNYKKQDLPDFGQEMSDYYKGLVIPTEKALEAIGKELPDRITYEGKTYVRCVNGYVVEEHANDPDALRGLYMLGMSSTFTFKINLTEWAHVYKQRNKSGHANPEVKELCETIADLLEEAIPAFNRELFEKIKN